MGLVYGSQGDGAGLDERADHSPLADSVSLSGHTCRHQCNQWDGRFPTGYETPPRIPRQCTGNARIPCPFPSLPDFHQVDGQSGHEVLEPSGHIHVALPDALDRPVEAGPVPVVVFADGEQALEVLTRAVQAQRKE